MVQPEGITLDGEGNFWVSDTGQKDIKIFHHSNYSLIDSVGPKVLASKPFRMVRSVVLDVNGNLVISSDSEVRVYNSQYEFKYAFGIEGEGPGAQFLDASGLAINLEGNYVVADYFGARVSVFSPEGDCLQQFGKPGSGKVEFNYPCGVTVDNHNNIYVTEIGNNRIQVLDHSGNFIRFIGGTRGTNEGEFREPSAVVVDANGDVAVADMGNGRIQIFSNDGKFLRTVGTKGDIPEDGQMDQPRDLVIDTNGNLIVLEQKAGRIQIWG